MSVDMVRGPIAYRSRGRLNKGQSIDSHTHNFGHATELLHGAVKMTRRWPNGEIEIIEYRVVPGEHYPVITVPAECKHSFTALEDKTIYRCAFVHRNVDGVPIENYEGFKDAYE